MSGVESIDSPHELTQWSFNESSPGVVTLVCGAAAWSVVLDARISRLESSDLVERERVLKVGVAVLIDIRSG